MAEKPQPITETRGAQMFPTLQAAEIDRLRRFGDVQNFKAGDVIVHAGEETHGIYLILSGKIRIAPHEVHRQAETIVTHGPGSFMGELAQLSGRPALVDSIAESDVGNGPGAEAVIQRLTRFTRPVNYLGLPSLAIPSGFTRTGLPVGIQLIGRSFEEATLLRIGAAFQRATDFHAKVPKLA